ncbi:MAG: hypothetical protein FWE40_09135 [Oscillospiraceae bacterium]|nr:hypothetical protein [Oscillospiraceae bacterium]
MNLKSKSKSFWIKVIAIVLVIALAAGTGLFLLLRRTPTMVIASRSEIIETWDNQGITRWMENHLGVRIQWVDYSEDTAARLQLDLTRDADDLPDVYLGLGLSGHELDMLIQQQAFLPFEYMLNHTPNLQSIINRDVDRLPQFRLNGSMVSFPAISDHFSESFPQKAWVNRDWQQQAGLDMPNNPQDFLNMLRTFSQQNDGAPSLGVAYGGSGANQTTLGFLVQSFVTTDFDLSGTGNFLNVRDGQVYAGFTQPEFRQALQMLNTIYSEGLVDSTLFTQGSEVFFTGGRGDERYGVIFANDLYALFRDADRAAAWDPLPPLNNNGHRSTLVRSNEVQLGGLMIPARIGNERHVRALQFGDALLSTEGTLTVLFGTEGNGWSAANANALSMGSGQAATWQLAEGGFNGLDFYGQFPGMVPFWMDARLQMDRQAPQQGTSLATSANWQGYLNVVTRENYEQTGLNSAAFSLPQAVLETADFSGLNVQGVSQYLTQASREFMTGARSIEGGWSDFIAELNSLGLPAIIAAAQAAYDAR